MIQTQALHFHYATSPEMFFADLRVPQGGTLLLHGNSGSGKSTWLALAAGMPAALAMRANALHQHATGLKAQIAATVDATALAGIDLAAGWPAL